MTLIDTAAKFKTEDDCLDYLEAIRWPKSEIGCVHCGEIGRISKITRESHGKNKRSRLYQCLACKKQFSVTSGTIFHDSHLPLVKWFTVISLFCDAKKGVSACQIQRHIGGSYRTSWYLAHRIREAMKQGRDLLTGVVETDETYLSPRKPRKGNPKPKNPNRDVVLGMVERGGKLRLVPIKDSKMRIIEPHMMRHISPDAFLQTDQAAIYSIIGSRKFKGRHRMINHRCTYGIQDNHTNTIENAFSLLKRGIYGSYHQVSIKHLARYCDEFSYRFNGRKDQPGLFHATLKGITRGKTLPYKTLTSPVSES